MSSYFARQGAAYINETKRSLGALLGIATGMLADANLSDSEILFLNEWLTANDVITATWPGNIIYSKVKDVLSQGTITEERRKHLVDTLQQLVGGTLSELSNSTHVTQLIPFDESTISFAGRSFCLTGEFVFAPRNVCEKQIEAMGGIIRNSISKKLHYLVVGGLGSSEWKHGSFGTKIERAMALRNEGASISIVHEDHWASSLYG